MEKAADISERIERLVPRVKSGTLRFFGEWFGRPYDNVHVIKRAEAEGECLIITFDNEERLSVWEPGGCEVSNEDFRINSASRVLWRWYYHGRPRTPEN